MFVRFHCLCVFIHLCLFVLWLEEYKGSPRRERISHCERRDDRPSTEDHHSSDSEGRCLQKRDIMML